MMKILVIVPTYNERENIGELIRTIRSETNGSDLDVLVVDSASPDHTAVAVADMQTHDSKIFLLEQSAKLGLGAAYQDGMRWAIKCNYDRVITMDADFSHHPRYLKVLLMESETKELVVGSRYTPGGDLKNWPLQRRLLSRFANWYARTITGLPFTDLTSGFHCFHADLLKQVMQCPLRADGYAFLVALKFSALVNGARFSEVPIIFSDRTRGQSKISKRAILESVFFVWKCFFQRHRIKTAKVVNPSLKKLKEMQATS